MRTLLLAAVGAAMVVMPAGQQPGPTPTPRPFDPYPVDLGYGQRLRSSGTRRLASPAMAKEILGSLQRISAPCGTRIEIESGVGVIDVR